MSDAVDFNLGCDDDEAPVVAAKPAKKTKAVGMPATVRIQLEESDHIPPTGLFVGLNGKGYLLRAGVPLDVPLGVAEILEHAITSTPVMDTSTQQVLGYRDRMQHPFRYLAPVTG